MSMLSIPHINRRRRIGGGGGGAGAPSTFPVVEATATYDGGGTVNTTHSVTLPASIASGDRLILLVNTLTDISTPSGWDLEASLTDISPAGHSAAVFSRTADGTEGATVSVTSVAASRMNGIAYRISGAAGVEASISASDTDDPPSLSPSWGSATTLWITAWFALTTNWTMPAAPSGFSGLLVEQSPSGSASTTRMGSASAHRTNEASSEDPAAWSPSGGTPANFNQCAVTIGIQPA